MNPIQSIDVIEHVEYWIEFIVDVILARPMAERTPNPVFEVVPEDILQVKIADLGNACWTVC